MARAVNEDRTMRGVALPAHERPKAICDEKVCTVKRECESVAMCMCVGRSKERTRRIEGNNVQAALCCTSIPSDKPLVHTPIKTPIIDHLHIHPVKGYTYTIHSSSSRTLPLVSSLLSIRINELVNYDLYRLLEGTPVPMDRLRRHHIL